MYVSAVVFNSYIQSEDNVGNFTCVSYFDSSLSNHFLQFSFPLLASDVE